MTPKHSIGFCPICGGGLLGVRVIDVEPGQPLDTRSHGLIVCDECEAIWVEPDSGSSHQYTDAEDPRSPVSHTPLWGPRTRWADLEDIGALARSYGSAWSEAVDRDLDATADEEIV